MMAFCC